MNLSTKILIFLGVCVTLGLLAFIIMKEMEISNRQAAIENNIVSQKQLVDGIVRSMSSFSSKEDLANFAKQSNIDLAKIQSDLNLVNGNVVAINKVLTGSKGYSTKEKGSDGAKNPNPDPPSEITCKDGTTKQCPNPDKYGYLKTQKITYLDEHFENVNVPFAKVGFSAWEEKPFDVNVYDREYNTVNVLGQDANGRHYVYSKMSLKVNGKNYDIKIKNAEMKEEYPTASFSFFNPQLFMGVSGTIDVTNAPVAGEFTPGLTIGLMSYGRTKTNPTISVAQIGAGYSTVSRKPSIIVNPVNFNIGSVIPGNLVRNTYIGPTMHVNTEGSVFFGGSVTVGF